jgi:hypothetical protein
VSPVTPTDPVGPVGPVAPAMPTAPARLTDQEAYVPLPVKDVTVKINVPVADVYELTSPIIKLLMSYATTTV